LKEGKTGGAKDARGEGLSQVQGEEPREKYPVKGQTRRSGKGKRGT